MDDIANKSWPEATPERDVRARASQLDERADMRAKAHELRMIKAKMGPVGRIIGSDDTVLNITFASIVLFAFSATTIACVVLW